MQPSKSAKPIHHTNPHWSGKPQPSHGRDKTIQVTLDPNASLSLHKSSGAAEKWIEDQVEELERWDGLS